MATLTIAEAAQRLGVKPGKVRQYITAHKLSARTVPSLTGARGHGQIMLDADEVEQLARLRAYKHQMRPADTGATDEFAAPAHDAATAALPAAPDMNHIAPDAAHEGSHTAPDAAHDEQMAGGATHDETTPLDGELDSGAVYAIDPTGQRTVALVQSLLAPLVAELHDARETIRRQAEELGALRAALTSLDQQATPPLENREQRPASMAARHLAPTAPLGHHTTTTPQSPENGATPHAAVTSRQTAPRSALESRVRAVSEPAVATPIQVRAPQTPVWRRAMAHLFRSS